MEGFILQMKLWALDTLSTQKFRGTVHKEIYSKHATHRAPVESSKIFRI